MQREWLSQQNLSDLRESNSFSIHEFSVGYRLSRRLHDCMIRCHDRSWKYMTVRTQTCFTLRCSRGTRRNVVLCDTLLQPVMTSYSKPNVVVYTRIKERTELSCCLLLLLKWCPLILVMYHGITLTILVSINPLRSLFRLHMCLFPLKLSLIRTKSLQKYFALQRSKLFEFIYLVFSSLSLSLSLSLL